MVHGIIRYQLFEGSANNITMCVLYIKPFFLLLLENERFVVKIPHTTDFDLGMACACNVLLVVRAGHRIFYSPLPSKFSPCTWHEPS